MFPPPAYSRLVMLRCTLIRCTRCPTAHPPVACDTPKRPLCRRYPVQIKLNSSAVWPMLPTTQLHSLHHDPLPDANADGDVKHTAARAPHRQPGLSTRKDITGRAPHRSPPTRPTEGRLTGTPEMVASAPKTTKPSFFSPAQTRVGESAPSALVATSIRSANATDASSGTDHLEKPGKASWEQWSAQTGSLYVSTGSCPKDAGPPSTPKDTDAPDVEKQITALKIVLEQKRLEATSPYHHQAWAFELRRLALLPKYPSVVNGLKYGFDLGISPIYNTFAPPNHSSILLLHDVYTSTVHNEFAASRYIGPLSHAQLEAELGPFQTSPLSFVPKASKPGKYRAVHNFSFPHNPLPGTASINSHIDSESFPCTWGTFTTVALLIARLPPGSQASVRDVAEAYRTIPANPSQWPGLVIRLQGEDQFAINVCNNFGLSSAGGVYGTVADAGADIFRGNGIGPLSKWVDDHIFFRIPRQHLTVYNANRAQWSREIRQQGGHQQEGGRLWFRGKNLPDDYPEEFDEDCSVPFQDLAGSSPRSPDDALFTYADADIDAVSERLGIRCEPSKATPFGPEVPYLGFSWDLHARTVRLLDKKRTKYLAAISVWEETRTHNLLETQQLYGKLLHASMVFPSGRAYLTNLEAMLALSHHSPFLPRTPPRDTPGDLEWWKRRLSQPGTPRPIHTPRPLIDHEAYSDASSGFGIAITIGLKWRAWKLAPGWNSQGRDILWAEAVGFELLVLHLLSISSEGEHIKVYGDNRGVVEGWWKRSSTNAPTNRVFRRILELSESRNRTIYTRYVPSAQNPADAPSRGSYPPLKFLLDDLSIPVELHPFLISIGPFSSSQNGHS